MGIGNEDDEHINFIVLFTINVGREVRARSIADARAKAIAKRSLESAGRIAIDVFVLGESELVELLGPSLKRIVRAYWRLRGDGDPKDEDALFEAAWDEHDGAEIDCDREPESIR